MQKFNLYAIYAYYGVRSNTPLGYLGRDIMRKRRKWFSRKYFASVMNIQEFYAYSLGQDLCSSISNSLNPDIMRRAVTL